MRPLFLFLSLLVALSAGFGLSAFAQEEPAPPVQTQNDMKPLLQQDLIDLLPDEVIDEASAFYDQCQSDSMMNQYFNCECLAGNYFQARIEAGPEETGSALMQKISTSCRDATGASGAVYQNCLSMTNRMKPGTDPEVYCTCVANNYAKAMDDYKPTIRSTNMVNMQTYAYTACNNPGGENPLFNVNR